METGNADKSKNYSWDSHVNDSNAKKESNGWGKSSFSGPERGNVHKSKDDFERLESSRCSNMEDSIVKKNNRGLDSWDTSAIQVKGQCKAVDPSDRWGKSRSLGPEKVNAETSTSNFRKAESSKWPDMGIGNKDGSKSSNWDRVVKDNEVKEKPDGWGKWVRPDNHSKRWGTALHGSKGWEGCQVLNFKCPKLEQHEAMISKDRSKAPTSLQSSMETGSADRSKNPNWHRHSNDRHIKKESDEWGKSFSGPEKGNVHKSKGNFGRLKRSRGSNMEGSIVKKNSEGWNSWDTSATQGKGQCKDVDPTDGWGKSWSPGPEKVNAETFTSNSGKAEFCKQPDVGIGHKGGSTSSNWDRFVKKYGVKEKQDGWGKWVRPDNHRKGWRIALAAGEGRDRSGSPGFKTSRRQSPNISPRRGLSGAHRSRSRSPFHGQKYGFKTWDKRGGTSAGGLVEPCRSFAAEGCTFGSEHRYLHKDVSQRQSSRHTDDGKSESWESRLERKKYRGVYNKEDFDDSLGKDDRYMQKRSSGPSFGFLNGSGHRGSRCRLVHQEGVSDGGRPNRNDARERSRDMRDSDAGSVQRHDPHRSSDTKSKKIDESHCPHGEDCRSHCIDRHGHSEDRLHDDRQGYIQDNNFSSAWNSWKLGDQALTMHISSTSQWMRDGIDSTIKSSHNVDGDSKQRTQQITRGESLEAAENCEIRPSDVGHDTPIAENTVTSEQIAQIKNLSVSLSWISQELPRLRLSAPIIRVAVKSEQVAQIKTLSESLAQISQQLPQPISVIPVTKEVITAEQAAQIKNLSASLAQVSQQLPQLYATLNSNAAVISSPLQPSSNSCALRLVSHHTEPMIQPSQVFSSQKHCHTVAASVSPEPKTSESSSIPPGFELLAPMKNDNVRQKSQMTVKSLVPSSATEDMNNGNSKNASSRESKLQVETAGKELSKIKSGSAQLEQTASPKTGESKNNESKGTQMFRFALIEYVKDQLKLVWEEGLVSKDAHKAIVRKVVDKVITTLPAPGIPRTPQQIDEYIQFSKGKLNKLIQAYLECYKKT